MPASGRPGDETAATQVLALPVSERRVLAALAIVGRGSLSAAELSDLTELDEVRPLIDDLEQRGLIRSDERKRYSAVGRVGEEIRKTDDALATGQQLFQYLTTLARGGALTPERLAEDAQAILGLTEWTAEVEQWATLLELVKTLQSCFAIANRVDEWLTLLKRGRTAARALGDRQSEIWVLQQMATASTRAGNASAAHEYLRAADELQRGRAPARLEVEQEADTVADSGRFVVRDGGAPAWALWTIGLLIAAVAGLATAFFIPSGPTTQGTATVRVTIRHTVTHTVTGQGGTAVSTTVELSTTTVTETTTTTTTTTTVSTPG
jgi:hypothetical protein